MGSEYPDAIDMFLPLSYTFSTVAPITIVDHGTGGDMTIEAMYRTFFATMRSSHFGIGRDGRVAQYVHLTRGAGANCCPDRDANNNPICDSFWLPYLRQYGNLNFCSLSIEHCNDSNNSLSLSDEQLLASQKLHLWLCNQYGIPIDHIKGHNTINPINKVNDPGRAFQWQEIFDFITSNGGVSLTAQDQAILDHFLAFFMGLEEKRKQSDPTGTPIVMPRTNTGIFNTYAQLYKKGIQLGSATTDEYDSVTWSKQPITCQDFGSYRIEWIQGVGPLGIFGPTGSIPLP